MNIEYYIINPAGNITALVTSAVPREKYKSIASMILSGNSGVEQVGFVNLEENTVNLNMSGDEFCGNATMSAAALYYFKKGLSGVFTTGVNIFPVPETIPVTVSLKDGVFECVCDMPGPYDIRDFSFTAGGMEYSYPLVCFGGIMHIVADGELKEADVKSEISRLAAELNTAALGVMFYNREQCVLKPLVYVAGVNTLYFENSCASGSCAVAAVYGEGENPVSIKQPGGIIGVCNLKDKIRLYTGLKIVKACSKEI